MQASGTAVRYDHSCDSTYDSQYDWHSKTPVLIDDLGGTWFLLSSSLGLWEPSRGKGLWAAWLGREEKEFFKTWAPLALMQILGTSTHSLKKAAVPVPGWGHVFCMPHQQWCTALGPWHGAPIGSWLYFLAAAIPNPRLEPQREAWGMLTEPAQEDQVILVGSQAKSTLLDLACPGWIFSWPLAAVLHNWVGNKWAQQKKTNKGGEKHLLAKTKREAMNDDYWWIITQN